MISKNEFLMVNKLDVMKKAKNKWFFSDDFEISKKMLNALINKIFDYLSRDDVYVNICDVNFVELIMKDLNDSVLNFISHFEDYEFICNFKGSIRHQPNKERDRLLELAENIPFEEFRPFLELILDNNTVKGGRPSFDTVLMLKTNFIRVYYDLSDEKTARRIRSDDACQCFLSYPDEYPSKSTIWDFRKKLKENGITPDIWKVAKNYAIEETSPPGKYVSQDACFFTQDKGQKNKDYPSRPICKNKTIQRWSIHEKKQQNILWRKNTHQTSHQHTNNTRLRINSS